MTLLELAAACFLVPFVTIIGVMAAFGLVGAVIATIVIKLDL